MFTDLVTMVVAGAAFAALFGAAGRRLHQSRPYGPLNVPGTALAALTCGWLIVAACCETLSPQSGTSPPGPPIHGTVSLLVRDTVLLLWTLAVLVLWRGTGSVRRLFPRWEREFLTQTGLAVAGYVALRLTVVATYNCTLTLAAWLGYAGPTGHPTLEVIAETENPYQRWVLIASVTLITPLLEEAMFRVALVGWFQQHVSLIGAVFASAVIFALFHWPPVTQPAMMVMGILMAWAYARTGSLYVPALMHAAFNLHSIVEVLTG